MALRKRTDSYWQKRAEQRLVRSERLSKQYMRQLRKVYNSARFETVKDIQHIYETYYKGQDGFDMQALRSIVPSGELKRFLNEMERLGISTNLPNNYNARITRLRLLNEQLTAQAHKVALAEQVIDSKALRANYKESFYRAGYDVAKGIGSTPIDFTRLDTQTIEKVMNARFEGRNFSKRVWVNSDILAKRLKNELAVAIAKGQSIQKTAANIRSQFDVGKSKAERLIRTETNHFHNEGELEAYKQMGFEKFRFMATLDNRTSEICAEMDGKIFDVKDGIPGDNVPPLHPNCRSTIVPYFKGYEPETRLYRDPETGRNGYTYNVPYTDWKQTLPPVRRETAKARSTETSAENKTIHTQEEISDGFSLYDTAKTKQYDELSPLRANDSIFKKLEPGIEDNTHEITLTRAEVSFFKRLDELGIKYELIKATWEARNDFSMIGKEWELKTVLAKSDDVIKHTFWKITDQGKRNAVIDVTYLDAKMSWVFDKVKQHLATVRKGEYDEITGAPITNGDLLDSVIIVRGSKIIRYK